MLVDTDVLIWHLRGYPSATRRLDELSGLVLSAVTYLELASSRGSAATVANHGRVGPLEAVQAEWIATLRSQ